MSGEPLPCVSEPTFPGCVVPALPVGLFRMADEKGSDDHVVCVPCHDPGCNALGDVEALPLQPRLEIGHSFHIYADLDRDRYTDR